MWCWPEIQKLQCWLVPQSQPPLNGWHRAAEVEGRPNNLSPVSLNWCEASNELYQQYHNKDVSIDSEWYSFSNCLVSRFLCFFFFVFESNYIMSILTSYLVSTEENTTELSENITFYKAWWQPKQMEWPILCSLYQPHILDIRQTGEATFLYA